MFGCRKRRSFHDWGDYTSQSELFTWKKWYKHYKPLDSPRLVFHHHGAHTYSNAIQNIWLTLVLCIWKPFSKHLWMNIVSTFLDCLSISLIISTFFFLHSCITDRSQQFKTIRQLFRLNHHTLYSIILHWLENNKLRLCFHKHLLICVTKYKDTQTSFMKLPRSLSDIISHSWVIIFHHSPPPYTSIVNMWEQYMHILTAK